MPSTTQHIFPTFPEVQELINQTEQRFALKKSVDALKERVDDLDVAAGGRFLRYAGSVAFNNLPSATQERAGNVYNISDAFTTTSAFLEGAGRECAAGTNVAIVSTDNGYAYDIIGSSAPDYSKLVAKEEGKGLSTHDFTDAYKTKLDSFRAATPEEFTAMLKSIYTEE